MRKARKTRQRARLPLRLQLQLDAKSALELKVLIQSKPELAMLADDQVPPEEALLVLADFQQEELAQTRRRVVGLPFVRRFLQDPDLLGKVPALPLYDLIYRCPGALCFSALTPAERARQQALAKWMGARCSEEVGLNTKLLVAGSVACSIVSGGFYEVFECV